MDTTRKDFFVSYTSADQAWAEWIAWQLEDADYSTRIQAWDFHAGDNFVRDMHCAASNTRQTIAVLSKDYLAAPFTLAEWTAAFAQDPTGEDRVLVPVRVGDCQPGGLLRAVTYVDLVGLDEATARQTLLAHLSGERLKPSRSPGFPAAPQPGFPGQPQAIGDLRAALLAGAAVPELDEATHQQILRHSPRTLEDYRLARIAEWSQARYALDKRFTRLTLLLDQGPDAQGARWQAQRNTYDDLRQVLAEAPEPALVLLGPPGCGKSTLLHRLELDLASASPTRDTSPAGASRRGGLRRPGACCAAAPGTTTATMRAAPAAITTTQAIATTLSVCGWCVSPTSCTPSESPAREGRAGNARRPRSAGRGEGAADGAGWSRPHGFPTRARAAGHISKRGASRAQAPRRPAPEPLWHTDKPSRPGARSASASRRAGGRSRRRWH